MKEIVCIVCPKGCPLKVDETADFAVSGAACDRGRAYGREEASNPTRPITSTVKIRRAHLPRCPVKTNGVLPKPLVREAVRLLDRLELEAPVHVGDVVLRNALGTGVDFVATRSMWRK